MVQPKVMTTSELVIAVTREMESAHARRRVRHRLLQAMHLIEDRWATSIADEIFRDDIKAIWTRMPDGLTDV